MNPYQKGLLATSVISIVFISRNLSIVLHGQLGVFDSITFLIQSACCIILTLYTVQQITLQDMNVNKNDVIKQNDEYHNKLLSWIQNHNRSGKKHMSLEENLSNRWKLSKNVINKVGMFVEYIFRDFIKYWYYSITKDDVVINDLENVLGNAFGLLLMRGRLGLNPITFVFDKCFLILERILWYVNFHCL